MKGPMSGILNGGPAMEPFRTIYMTADGLDMTILRAVTGLNYLDRTEQPQPGRPRHNAR